MLKLVVDTQSFLADDGHMVNDPEIVFIVEKYYDYAYSRRFCMKKIGQTFFTIVILSMLVFFLNQGSSQKARDVGLWPEIKPFTTGYLQVSAIHKIYYELSGNPKGKPVVFLHGGPGGRSSPYMRRFSNPEKFLIILYDQRGCGKSEPYGELKENTTPHLVQDIEQLRSHLKLDKLILLGGSWGSTLALAYAETHPNRVSGIILRGVFTATREEIDHFYHDGLNRFFPDLYDKLIHSLPDPTRRPLPDYLYQLISKGSPAEKRKYSHAWTEYELKASELHMDDRTAEDYMKGKNFYAFGLFENHYMSRGCFLEEGQLMKNIDRITHIPVILVNGRYDVICPPITAYRLHKKLPKSKLVIAEKAGHWMGEPPIEKALLKAMKTFE